MKRLTVTVTSNNRPKTRNSPDGTKYCIYTGKYLTLHYDYQRIKWDKNSQGIDRIVTKNG
jgi:hypothetical protein